MAWKAKAKDSALDLINWLLQRRAQHSGASGWPVDLETDWAMQELGNSLERPLSTTAVMTILTRMGPGASDPLAAFLSAYEEDTRSREAALASATPWRFVLPFRLRLPAIVSTPLPLRVDGETFSLVRYSDLDEEQRAAVDPSRLQAQALFLGESVEIKLDEAFIVAAKIGPTSGLAWDLIASSFDLFRGIVEYVFDRGTARLFTTRQQPRSHVPHPALVAAISGPHHDAHRFDIGLQGTPQVDSLTQRHVSLLEQVSSMLATPAPESSTVSLIADALRLYVQALDASTNHTCLGALWQLAEATTCAAEMHGASDEVAKRLTWHTERWNLPGAGLRETIVELANKRNLIVHKGIHHVADDEINTLKYLCEATIEWLIAARARLPTRSHVRMVYRMRTLSDAELRAEQEVAEFVKEAR